MKRFKMNKYLAIGLGLVVTIALFILGRHEEASGMTLANAAVVTLTDAEKTGFNDQEQKVILAVKKLTEQMKGDLASGVLKKEELGAAIAGIKMELGGEAAKTLKEKFDELKEIAKTQGTTLQELGMKYTGIETGNKSISQVMEENKQDIADIYSQGSGTKQFMVQMNDKKEFVCRAFDPMNPLGKKTPTNKTADVHGTIANIGGGGGSASIAQSLDAASLLRLGGDSPIISQYRNTPWIFELCNLVNAGFEMPLAMWFEEQARQGASANVAEGGTKPKEQYAYTLKSATYRKEAVLLGFTDEFNLDFARLQSDILGKGRVDLINRINTAILARVITAATAYNTATEFKGGTAVPSANDFDVLAAMAAQVDNATFGANANAAVMSTFKKYRMGVLKSSQAEYLNRPEVINNLSFVGNPEQATDDVMVGDFKQYNILLRGGLIVKVGYNGTDFAENRFSVVMEQFYFDYISAIRAAAIVKGPDFATVKAAIAA
jgi:hypothetical protein